MRCKKVPDSHVHEGVRKAHFCAVYQTVAHGLNEGKDIVVRRVEDEALYGHLVCRARVSS